MLDLLRVGFLVNNENDNLDMTNLKTENEDYVKNLEKYEKLNEK